MRTIRRKALAINLGKLNSIHSLCKAYAKEKNHWLDTLKAWEHQAFLGNPRKLRDEFIQKKYQSPYGLQARHWKLAFQDAVETWDKNWKAQFLVIRRKVAAHFKLEKEKHYAFWLIKGYCQFAEMMQGKVPLPHFDIETLSAAKVAKFVQRQVKKFKPSVKKAGIIKNGSEIFIHTAKEIITKKTPQEKIEAVDFGYSEVMTDTDGNRYGLKFGKLLSKASDSILLLLQNCNLGNAKALGVKRSKTGPY